MKSRLAASIALTALVTSARRLRSHHPAGDHQDYAADRRGERPNVGHVDVRNAFIVVDKEGTAGNLWRAW